MAKRVGGASSRHVVESSLHRIKGHRMQSSDHGSKNGSDKRAGGEIHILPIAVSDEIYPGASLSTTLLGAMREAGLQLESGDILVVKHKIVSKAEGAIVSLDEIKPKAASREWARRYRLDARVVELALRESRRIVRRKRGVLITGTRHGLVCANSGVDVSNVNGGKHALLLPADPDGSARRLRRALQRWRESR